MVRQYKVYIVLCYMEYKPSTIIIIPKTIEVEKQMHDCDGCSLSVTFELEGWIWELL